MNHYGHVDCGVYLGIISGGALAPGERLELVVTEAPDPLPMR
jgi:hypothetical protein